MTNRVRGSLVAALFAVGYFSSIPLGAADLISTYVDSRGRVVFVNEASPQTAGSLTASPELRSSVSSPYRNDIHRLIEWAAERHQVDPELIRAIVQVESNFNPYAVSPKGAKGLMQLIPATAQRFGVGNAFDPQANLDGGIRYLKYLMELFNGDLQLSLAAYNAGENSVGRYRSIPPYRETRDYVRKIGRLYSLDRPLQSSVQPIEPRILKSVDRNGVVHFSNTDLR